MENINPLGTSNEYYNRITLPQISNKYQNITFKKSREIFTLKNLPKKFTANFPNSHSNIDSNQVIYFPKSLRQQKIKVLSVNYLIKEKSEELINENDDIITDQIEMWGKDKEIIVPKIEGLKYPNEILNLKEESSSMAHKYEIKNENTVLTTENSSEEKEQKIIARLKREVKKEDPASISQISKDFGYKTKKTVTKLSKRIFSPEIYESKWGSKKGQKIIPDEIVYQRLIEELKKEKLASLESIGKDLGFADGGPVRRVPKERISNEVYIQAWGKSDIRASDLKDIIIERLEKEIVKERTASLRSIGLEFGFSSGNPIREIAIGHFSEEVYLKAWGRQDMTEDIEKDIIDTLKEEVKKDSPRPLKDIGYEFGFKSGDPIIRIAQNIFSDEIYMKKWGRPTTSPIIINEIKRCLKKQLNSENPMSLSEISREFNLNDYAIVRRIAKNSFSEQIYQNTWGIEEISDEIKNAIKYDILNGNLSMNQIAQRYNISASPIRTISLKIEFENQNYIHSERFPQRISALLGTEIHPIIQKIVTKHFSGFFLKIFSEIVVNQHTGNKIDLLIPNIDSEKSLINFFANQSEVIKILADLNLNLEKLNKYKALLFDPTMDLSKKSIIGKILKYQHPNLLFFIVDYRRMGIWQTRPIHIFNIPSDSRIKYPQNVKIIDYIIFSKLIGLKDELKQYFFNSIHLVADILILDSEERDFSQELEKIREYNSLIMQERFHNQDFYDYLKLHNFNYRAFFKRIGSIEKFYNK